MSRVEIEKRINSAISDLHDALEMIDEEDMNEALGFLEYAQATLKETIKQIKKTYPRRVPPE